MRLIDINEVLLYDGYWYLASPYSKYPGGLSMAFREVTKAAAKLIQARVSIFCPITHTHPLAFEGGIDPLAHDIWMPADRPLLDASVGLIVLQLVGWEMSVGVTEEIEISEQQDKPIFGMPWDDECRLNLSKSGKPSKRRSGKTTRKQNSKSR